MNHVAIARFRIATAVALALCASTRSPAQSSDWDGPCDDGKCIAGVTNFGKVSANLWRGAKRHHHRRP